MERGEQLPLVAFKTHIMGVLRNAHRLFCCFVIEDFKVFSIALSRSIA